MGELARLRARLAEARSYPDRAADTARYLELDAELYRSRLSPLSNEDLRRENLSLADRLGAPTNELTSAVLQSRQGLVSEAITQRTGMPDLTEWIPMINFDPPIEQVPTKQSLFGAEGRLINLDYYPVHVGRMPVIDGREITPRELIEMVRDDFPELASDRSGWFVDFGFDRPIPHTGTGLVNHVDMGWLDDGTVVVTENAADHWRMSTVVTFGDQAHPVAGSREVGISPEPYGAATIYTRGADRPSGVLDDYLSTVVLGSGEDWWKQWQKRVRDFVIRHGGSATVGPPTAHRLAWDDVAEFARRRTAQPYAEAGRMGMFHGGPPAPLDPPSIPAVIALDLDFDLDLPSLNPARGDGPMSIVDGPDAVSLDPSRMPASDAVSLDPGRTLASDADGQGYGYAVSLDPSRAEEPESKVSLDPSQPDPSVDGPMSVMDEDADGS